MAAKGFEQAGIAPAKRFLEPLLERLSGRAPPFSFV
jgi:hypothetical protein